MIDSPERELWLAVINGEFLEARRGCPDARLWFWRKGQGYRYVCALAGVDDELISERVVSLYPPVRNGELWSEVA